VEELGLDSSVDTLSRWLVHFIAEQAVTAKHATGSKKSKAKQCCLEIVSKLQQYQLSSAHNRHHFENFKPISRVLNGVDLKKGKKNKERGKRKGKERGQQCPFTMQEFN